MKLHVNWMCNIYLDLQSHQDSSAEVLVKRKYLRHQHIWPKFMKHLKMDISLSSYIGGIISISTAVILSTGHSTLYTSFLWPHPLTKAVYNWECDSSSDVARECTEVILKNPHYLKVTFSFTALHKYPNLEVAQAALMSRWWTSVLVWVRE